MAGNAREIAAPAPRAATADAPGTGSPLGQRRRFTRFATAIRVDYELDGRQWSSFTSEISSGGLSLRGAKAFKTGQTVVFHLTLPGASAPLHIQAIVRRVGTSGPQAGFGFEFAPDQDHVRQQIRDFFSHQYVPKLEELVARSPRNVDKVVQLASFYLETGRHDDGLRLLRKAAVSFPDNIDLLEALAWGLIDRARALGTEAWPILKEIDLLFDRSRDLPQRPSFLAAKQSAAEVTQQIELRQQDEERTAEQLRDQRHAEELAKLSEKIVAETTAANLREANERIQHLEAVHAHALDAIHSENQRLLQEKQRELDRVSAALREASSEAARLAADLERARQEIQGQISALQQEKDAHACTEQQLADTQQQIAGLEARWQAEQERLATQRHEIERELQRLNEARIRTRNIERALENEFWLDDNAEPVAPRQS